MSLTRKLAGHTLIQVIGRLSANAIGVLIVALLTRYLGEEGFGNYTTILAYLFFFAALADLGLYLYTINELGRPGVDRHRFFSAIFSLRLFTGLGLLVMAGLLVWLMPYPELVKLGVAIMAIAMFFVLLEQIEVAYYQTEMKMVRPALADAIGKVVMLVGVFIGISLGAPLLTLLWAVVIGNAVQFTINTWGILRRVRLRLRIDWSMWRQVVQQTWPIAVSQIFVLIYFKMDTIFLSLLRPAEIAQIEVGTYGAPYKVLEVLIALVPLFMGLITPLLARAWSEKNQARFKELYQRAFDTLSVVAIPLVLGGAVLARPIMTLIAPGFARSVEVLPLLMLATGVIFFAHLPTYVINTIHKQRQMLPSYAIAAALAVVLYVLLIPRYGLFAAAGVTVVIEALVLTMAWLRVRRVARVQVRFNIFSKALLASLIMAAVLWLLSGLNVFVLLIIGAVVYLVVMLFIKGIPKDFVREILSKSSSEIR